MAICTVHGDIATLLRCDHPAHVIYNTVYKNMLNRFYTEGSEDFETAVKALKEETVDKTILQVN